MFRIILCLNGLQPADWYALRCSCSDCTLFAFYCRARMGQSLLLRRDRHELLRSHSRGQCPRHSMPQHCHLGLRGLAGPSDAAESTLDQPFQTCSASRQRGFVPVGISVYVDVSMPAFANQAGATIATSAPGIRHSVANWQSIFDDKADAAPSFWNKSSAQCLFRNLVSACLFMPHL